MERLLPIKPTVRVLRQFAAAWLVFFLTLSAIAFWKRHNVPACYVFAAVALVGIAGLIKPAVIRPLFIVASIAAFPIGWIVSQIMLAIMFFGLVTPIAFFMRMRGRDALQLRSKTDASTFWKEREPQPPPERYLKQF